MEIDSRWVPLQASMIYLDATKEAQHSVTQKVSSIVDRIGRENQIAVVREIANTFEERTYPSILDQLAASPRSNDASGNDEPIPAPIKKQTVSVKEHQRIWSPWCARTPRRTLSLPRRAAFGPDPGPPRRQAHRAVGDNPHGNRTAEELRHVGQARAHAFRSAPA
ncbi:hypothetical protein [Propioniciclava flava]